MATLARWFDQLARPPEDVREENLRAWRTTIQNTTPIEEVRPRQRTRVAGVVENIRIDPRGGRGYIEATISDGSGELVARWLGRSTLSGITLGTGLVVEGVTGVGSDRELVILNPEYELVPGPHHR